MSTWNSRPYQPGDEQAITALYENVFQIPMSMERWMWRYGNNPTGQIAIELAAADDQRIVGQYAVMPVAMKVGDDEAVASLSLDTMVHSEFRGQRMFTKLADALYERLAAEGMPLVYGFPNSQSYPGFVKHLGWHDLVEHLPVFVRPLKFSKLLAKTVPSGLLAQIAAPPARLVYRLVYRPGCKSSANLQLRALDAFDARSDRLWAAARDTAAVLIRRDQAYLNWRYVNHPDRTYSILAAERGDTLVGYVVAVEQEIAGMAGLFITDLLADPAHSDVPAALIAAVVRQARQRDCDLVNCLMLPHHPYAAVLKQCGFVLAPPRMFPQEIHLGARNLGSPRPDTFIHDSRNWYITWGDHDSV